MKKALSLITVLVAATTQAFGANRTWSGTTNNNASLAANWGGAALVSGADWLSFTNDPTNKTPTFATNFTAVGTNFGTPIINFTATAGNFTLDGAGVITIDAKNSTSNSSFVFIQSASATTQTINNNLLISNTGTNTNSFNSIRSLLGTLNLGNVTDNTRRLSFQATNAAAKINIASLSAAEPLVAGNNLGTVTITDARLITGLFQVQAGTLVLGSSLTAGTNNTIRLSSNSGSSSTLKILDGVNFINNIVNNPTSGATTQTLGLDSGIATFSGTVTSGSAFTTSVVLNAGTGATLNMAGGIIGGRPIIKDGAGTVILTAANTYSGGTTVSTGTLLVNNGTGSATGAGAVAVVAGASLGGSGRIAGATTIGGILAPGNSIGTLTVANDVIWNGNLLGGDATTDWKFELGAANTADLLQITGATSEFIKGTGTTFRFDFMGSTATGTFKLVDWDSIEPWIGGEVAGTNFSIADFTYTNLGGNNLGTFQFNGTQLEFQAIPEPSALQLFGIGLISLLACHRINKRNG